MGSTPSADFCPALERLTTPPVTQHSNGRSPAVSSTAFGAHPPDLSPVRLMEMSFAIMCSLAPHRRPHYPVLVHRLAPLLHASFRPRLATTVGIELGRADFQVEGYQPRPFGCEVGSQFHQGHVSRGPPIIPDGRFSQVRFETLACLPWAFPTWRGLSAGSHTPRLPQFAHSLAPPHASAHRRFCARPPRCRWNRQVSRVPLPNVEVILIGETCLVS